MRSAGPPPSPGSSWPSAVELGLANAPLIHTVDRRRWEEPRALARVIERAEKGEEGPPSVRCGSRAGRTVGSIRSIPDRYPLEDRVEWQRRMFIMRQNLPLTSGVVVSFGTLDNNEHEAWFDTLPLPDKAYLAPRRSYDAWGTEYFVVDKTTEAESFFGSTVGLRTSWASADAPAASPIIPFGPPLRQINTDEDGLPSGVFVLKNDSPFPAAWIVHRILPLDPIPPGQRERWLPVMTQLVFPRENAIDLRRNGGHRGCRGSPARSAKKAIRWPGGGSDAAEPSRIVPHEAGDLEIEAILGAEEWSSCRHLLPGLEGVRRNGG